MRATMSGFLKRSVARERSGNTALCGAGLTRLHGPAGFLKFLVEQMNVVEHAVDRIRHWIRHVARGAVGVETHLACNRLALCVLGIRVQCDYAAGNTDDGGTGRHVL